MEAIDIHSIQYYGFTNLGGSIGHSSERAAISEDYKKFLELEKKINRTGSEYPAQEYE